MRVAVAQMCSGIDPAANVREIARLVRIAADSGATLLTTPEMAVLVDRDRSRAAAHILPMAGNPQIDALSRAAREANIWLHVGSIPVRLVDGRFANRTLLFAPDGRLQASYDKQHMFDVALDSGERWTESAAYRAGDRPAIAMVGGWRVGLTICYDVRFPELYAQLALAGADLILIPAAFTVPTGRAHWEVLLRARAIETGAFVIAAAQAGVHADGRETWGHSMVVDPWGEVMLDMEAGEGLGFVTLDRDRVAVARRQMPSLLHRRPLAGVATDWLATD